MNIEKESKNYLKTKKKNKLILLTSFNIKNLFK